MTVPDTLNAVTLPGDPQSESPTRSVSWARRYSRRLLVSDLIVLVWTFTATHIFCANLPRWSVNHAPYSARWMVASLCVITFWFLALTITDSRETRVVGAGPSEYKRVINATVTTFASIALVGYVLQSTAPRSYVLVAMGLGTTLLILSRWSWRQWLFVNRQNGRMTTSAVAIGSENALHELIANLHSVPHAGYRIVGICPTSPLGESTVASIPIIASLDTVVAKTAQIGAEVIIIAASDATHPAMVRRLGWELEGYEVDLILAPALANIAGPRVHIRPVAGLPLLHVERPAYKGAQRWAKVLFDRCGALVLIVLALPVMIPAAVAVAVTSRGPIIYRQERAGKDRQSFRMFKFRTMVVGADEMIGQLDLQPDAGNELLFKIRDDPRVTRVGRYLRRYSIDELPQLFNVLTGEMSLVGPRPPLLREVSGYQYEDHRRLLVRPGITGLWQVSGRSDLNWEETIRLDLYYVENWSLMGDLVILWRTARAVLSSQGAY